MTEKRREPRIISVEPISEKKIRLHYASGEWRIFDMSPYIKGKWFGMLNDEAYFRAVRICEDCQYTVEWPEGQDVAPHELYDYSVPAYSPIDGATTDERKKVWLKRIC